VVCVCWEGGGGGGMPYIQNEYSIMTDHQTSKSWLVRFSRHSSASKLYFVACMTARLGA